MSSPSAPSSAEPRIAARLPTPTTMFVKRTFDLVLASLFVLAFSWVYLLVCLGVCLSSGAPCFYTQARYGRDGKIFRIYKFRSMHQDADQMLHRHLQATPAAHAEWQIFQKLRDDPRVTRFGAFIRKYSLDELPQIWNVLRGDMSLVGPRPCMSGQEPLYEGYWGHYCAVRPGITGLWQVSGRNRVSYRRRAAMDAAYVEALSLRTDLLIILKTVLVITSADGSH